LSNGGKTAFNITVTSGTLLVEDIGALPAGGSLTIGAGGTVVLAGGLSAADASGAAASQAAAVPEPGTVVLLAAGALLGMARLGAVRWLTAVVVADAALRGGTARAGVIIADTFTTGAPEPFIQLWHQTAELLQQPETNLPCANRRSPRRRVRFTAAATATAGAGRLISCSPSREPAPRPSPLRPRPCC
jgi:hypothetical protein